MKTIKLLLISIVILFYFACKKINENGNQEVTKIENNEADIEEKNLPKQSQQEFLSLEKSGLEGKKFYFLMKNKNDELVLEKYPQYPGDFEMKKYIFTQDMFIEGDNVMEPSEWKILKIFKRDTIIKYILKMKYNDENIDTLILTYNPKKGLLYRHINEDYPPIILIDSTYSDKIQVVNKYFEDED